MANLERRLSLEKVLRSRRDGAALKELAERFGVSKQTLQRDIDALSSAGIPIEEFQHGQRLRFAIRSHEPMHTSLTAKDIAALTAVREALKPFRRSPLYRDYDAALTKLSSGSTTQVFEGKTGGAARIADSTYNTLLSAMLSNRRCAMTYTPRDTGESRAYAIEPY